MLEAHPSVRNAVAVAVSDPQVGERVAAVVVTTGPFDLEECREWFAEPWDHPVQDPRARDCHRLHADSRGRQAGPGCAQGRWRSAAPVGAVPPGPALCDRLYGPATRRPAPHDRQAGLGQSPENTASRSWCHEVSPKLTWSSCERFTKRCMSCSQVNPIPPWT